MSSPSSPYKEVGLRAGDVAKKRRVKERHEPCSYDRKKLPVFGHDFMPMGHASQGAKRGRYVLYSSVMTCRKCGHPRFAVDGVRCKGKKTWTASR